MGLELALLGLGALIVAYVLLRNKLHSVGFIGNLMDRVDAWFMQWFDNSRTILLGRGLAFIGWFVTVFESVQAVGVLDLVGALPNVPGWFGPLMLVIGHLVTYLRKDTTGPVKE